MKIIFYLIGILFVINEFMWLVSPLKRAIKSRRFNHLTKKEKGGDWNNFSEEYKKLLIGQLYNLPLFLWLFIGLFTFNWFAFLVILVFNIFIVLPLSKIVYKSLYLYTTIHWLNSLIGFGFGLFVIINSYHLKIDLYQFTMSILNL